MKYWIIKKGTFRYELTVIKVKSPQNLLLKEKSCIIVPFLFSYLQYYHEFCQKECPMSPRLYLLPVIKFSIYDFSINLLLHNFILYRHQINLFSLSIFIDVPFSTIAVAGVFLKQCAWEFLFLYKSEVSSVSNVLCVKLFFCTCTVPLLTMHSGKSQKDRVVEDNERMGERKGECIMTQHVYYWTCWIPFTYGGFRFKKKKQLPMGENDTRWASIKELLLPRFCMIFVVVVVVPFSNIQDKHFGC